MPCDSTGGRRMEASAQEAEVLTATLDGNKIHVKARNYQRDLVEVAKENNVIISLTTGAGKTLIAAEVIRARLPALKAAHKAVLFMAPTNPLVAQQCDEALARTHGFRTRAYHGTMNNQRLSSWDRDKWRAVLEETDVLVMTPDVLLHTLSHGAFRMKDIGLLIFDEAHHCKGDHPYNQLLQDFYHTLPLHERPQILGLTASPDGMEKDERRRKGKGLSLGLQHNMNAHLITVPSDGPLRAELDAAVPWPSTHVLNYKSVTASGVVADSLQWLNWMKDFLLRPAKRCEAICELLRRQELLASTGLMDAGVASAGFEGFAEGGRVAALDKQIRGVLYCLENLGPWCAAAAAYLDLLAPPAEEDREGELEAASLGDQDDMNDPGVPLAPRGDSSRIFYDELGGPPELLLVELRTQLASICEFLRAHAQQPDLAAIITSAELDEATTPRPQDLPAAAAAAEASRALAEAQKAAQPGEVGGLLAGGIATGAGGCELEWCARGLLKLSCKVALLITMNVLADVLVDDKDLKQQLMQEAGGNPGCVAVEHRMSGSLQGFAEILLRRVPFNLLEAQVWPELRSDRVRPWQGPPLLTDKVVKLLRLLETDRKRCVAEAQAAAAAGRDDAAAAAAAEEWWACMVFVETKLSALVLSKLLSSLPVMRQHLRAGYLLGDTRHDGTAGGLAMNNKQQAQVVAGFRTSAINVLIATSVGSEGMDFKQCQLVVAFDLPRDVTSYIQCRGRGRKPGSRYCFMQQEEHKLNIFSLIRKADALEARARDISAQNRTLLAATPTAQLRPAPEPVDCSTQLQTPCGAVATLRLAQQMLAEYCAKLPGSDRVTMLQAYYSTRVSAGLFHTVIYLPSNSGIPSRVDDAPPGLNSKQSKQQAALRALRLLYAAGKLNEYLQPVWVTQKHHKQLEAEPLPNYTATIRLQRPLHPQPLEQNWTAAAATEGQNGSRSMAHTERTLTLHLHTFVYGTRKPLPRTGLGKGSGSTPQPAPVGSEAAVAEAYSAAETSLLAAVVGSDEALAAMPSGPSVEGGMKQPALCKLGFGVLLWERLPRGLMQWPVWIERKLYVMDVVYEGPLVLTESQVQQLLKYQSLINKHTNWDKTRAEWLRQALELDKQEAEAAAAAAADNPAPMQVDDPPAAAVTASGEPAATVTAGKAEGEAASAAEGAGEGEGEPSGEQQRQPMLPFKPDLLNSLIGWDRKAPNPAATAVPPPAAAGQADITGSGYGSAHLRMQEQGVADAVLQQQQTQEQQVAGSSTAMPVPPAAAAAQQGCDSDAGQAWSPPNKLSFLIVPLTNSSSSTDPGPTSGPKAAVGSCPASAPPPARGNSCAGLAAAEVPSVAASAAGALPIAGSSAEVAQRPAAAPTGTPDDSSSKSAMAVDWAQVAQMAAGLMPLSSFMAEALGLPPLPHVDATRMELPPPVPPAPLTAEQVAAAAAAGQPLPLTGAACMAPLHPSVRHAAVCALEAALKGRVVVAGHSSHVYSAIGIAAGLTPCSSLSAAVARLARQMVFSTATNGSAQPGDSGSTAAKAAAGGEGHAAAGHAGLAGVPGVDSTVAAGSASVQSGDTRTADSSTPGFTSFAPLLASANPEMAAALLLSSSMVEFDPEKRPMLGWKVGKAEDGQPIWQSADSHDEYYRLRCGITGLRPDLPMLAVKSSRGLTDSCLLPPKPQKNSITLPGLSQAEHAALQAVAANAAAQGAAEAAAVAAAANYNASCGPAAGMDTQPVAAAGGASKQGGSQLPTAHSEASAAAKSASFAGASGSCPAAHGPAAASAFAPSPSPSPKRTLSGDCLHPSSWQSGPDKRRKVSDSPDISAGGAAGALEAAGATSTATAYTTEKVDRLAVYEQHYEQQQQQEGGQLGLSVSLAEAITQQSKQLVDMSRSGRRKVWAAHRVMFLPLELTWLLPITAQAWSQLQLIPNIVYRIHSMLGAASLHQQLQELLHGGGRQAAAAVYNAPEPVPGDAAQARADGWDMPLPMHELLSELSHRELALAGTEQEQQQPAEGKADGAAAAADGGQPGGSVPDAAAAGAAAAVEKGPVNGGSTGRSSGVDEDMSDAPNGVGGSAAAGEVPGVAGGSPACAAAPDELSSEPAAAAKPAGAAAKTAAPGKHHAPAGGKPWLDANYGRGRWQHVPLPSARLLLLALTASSCHEAFDLERLEFLGDVVLKVLASCCMLKVLPTDANEGELSMGKARLVRNLRLAQLGSNSPLLLQYQLRFHPFDNSLWTPTGDSSVLGLFAGSAAHTLKGKRIADGIESLIGAFYLAGAAQEAAQATAGSSSGTAAAAAAAASSAGGGGGGGLCDAASWVWHRVSRPGLVAAAALCEALSVLPAGAAATLAGSPMPKASAEHHCSPLSLLHPSYTAAISNFFNNAQADGRDPVVGEQAVHERLVGKLGKLLSGPFPYSFSDPSWLAQSVTHVSVLGATSYQRLEFLGDALLDLVVSLRTLSGGRGQGFHLGPADLTVARASAVANNTLATAAVLSGLHNMLHANSWRLLLGVRTFAADVLAKHGKLQAKETAAGNDLDKESAAATRAALQLAANAGLLKLAATAAEDAGSAAALAAAAKAATQVMATAVAGKMGVGTEELARHLARDVLDDDTIWAAVWLRRKELAAIHAAAAHATNLAAHEAAGGVDRAAMAPGAAADGGSSGVVDEPMQDAEAAAAGGGMANGWGSGGYSGGDAEGQDGSGEQGEDGSSHDGNDGAGSGSDISEVGNGGGKKKKLKLPKVMADLVEALVAAVYVDSGGDWGPTWDAVNHLLYSHQQGMPELQLKLPQHGQGEGQQAVLVEAEGPQ